MPAPLSLDRVRQNGVVGAGGAGFPTYQKLAGAAEVAILNAAECEPLLHKDKQLLERYGDEVLAGLRLAADRVGASRVVVAIKDKYVDLIAELRRKAAPLDIEVHLLGDFYPAGDEFVTVYEVTGRVIPPGGLPGHVGCVVTNVETALNLVRDVPVTHKYLSVAGAVPEPVTVRAPVGLAFGELLRGAGVDPAEVGSVLVGGVMMGRLMESFDEVVTRTTGALLCFPPGHSLPARYATPDPIKARIGRSACDQCSFCTEMCPRYLLGHPIEPHKAMRGLGFQNLGEGAMLGNAFCCECNLCSLYACPEDLFPMNACRDTKPAIRASGSAHPLKGQPTQPHSMRDYRRIPLKSLIQKLGLSGFRNVGPLREIDWRPRELRVPLAMHIGAPAVATVKVGQRVTAGDVLGAPPADALGVPVHAPVDAVVTAVGDAVVLSTTA
ncbi:MAG: 4Fe-4S dicluster domain-containing protein [Planctomycetes bacterium]|nr:4Fe-4S dicluster domain-containing protein [Planctomycetota bacterium]